VREVAAAHPGLADLAPQLTADGVALSLSPFVDDEDQDNGGDRR
jgi:phage tail protein X